jgi:hypothetical protein
MKYGEYFRINQIPEWKKAYIDYDGLKDKITELLKLLPKEQSKLLTVTIRCNPAGSENFLRPTDIEGTIHCAESGKTLRCEAEFEYDITQRMYVRKKVSYCNVEEVDTDEPEGEDVPLAENVDPLPTFVPPSDVFYQLRDILYAVSRVNESFHEALLANIERVNVFYKLKSHQFSVMAARVLDNIKSVGRISSGNKQRESSFLEIHHALDILLTFCLQNSAAVRKIVKKYSKSTQQSLSHHYQLLLSAQPFFMEGNSNAIERLQRDLEIAFANSFMKGDTKSATMRLRSIRDDQLTRERNLKKRSVHVGMFAGAIAVLLIMLVFDFIQISLKMPAGSVMDEASYIFALSFLGIALALLFSFNVLAWEHFQINYVFIFELDPRDHFDSLSLMRSSLTYMFCWCAGAYAYIRAVAMEEADSSIGTASPPSMKIPYAMLALCFVIWILENTLQPKQRRWWGTTMLHIIIAPFHKVSFSDFFVADQLTSVGALFFESQFALCLLHVSAADETCASMKQWRYPWLVLLPHWWRWAQCWRRAYDARLFVFHPNVNNSFKYLSGIGTVLATFVVSFAHNSTDDNTTLILVETLFILTAFGETVYKLWWDYIMDWGLFEPNSKRRFLRRELRYPIWFYYFAIVTNLLGRVLWIVRYTVLTRPGVQTYYWGFFAFSFVEILRRFQWNFLRVENEQLNNTEKYRAVKVTPPPCLKGTAGDCSAMLEEDEDSILQRVSSSTCHVELSPITDQMPKEVLLQDKSRITEFFAVLPEEEKCKLLRFIVPDQTFDKMKGTGKTAFFSRLHEEDKIRGMLLLAGRRTFAEYQAELAAAQARSSRRLR